MLPLSYSYNTSIASPHFTKTTHANECVPQLVMTYHPFSFSHQMTTLIFNPCPALKYERVFGNNSMKRGYLPTPLDPILYQYTIHHYPSQLNLYQYISPLNHQQQQHDELACGFVEQNLTSIWNGLATTLAHYVHTAVTNRRTTTMCCVNVQNTQQHVVHAMMHFHICSRPLSLTLSSLFL